VQADREHVLASLALVALEVDAGAALAVGQVADGGIGLGAHPVELAAVAGAALEPLAGVGGDRDGFDAARVLATNGESSSVCLPVSTYRYSTFSTIYVSIVFSPYLTAILCYQLYW